MQIPCHKLLSTTKSTRSEKSVECNFVHASCMPYITQSNQIAPPGRQKTGRAGVFCRGRRKHRKHPKSKKKTPNIMFFLVFGCFLCFLRPRQKTGDPADFCAPGGSPHRPRTPYSVLSTEHAFPGEGREFPISACLACKAPRGNFSHPFATVFQNGEARGQQSAVHFCQTPAPPFNVEVDTPALLCVFAFQH